jgi:predicted choloylglycine hydrolase
VLLSLILLESDRVDILNLSGCYDLPKESLFHVTKCVNLTDLNASSSNMDDEVLTAIGRSCVRLHRLIIENCKAITDTGLCEIPSSLKVCVIVCGDLQNY